ncbi:hypothetical protein GBAR_LOCUS30866, partial [Geodia barretti]
MLGVYVLWSSSSTEMPNTDWRPSFCERQVYCRVALPDLALLALPPHTRQWRS